MGQGETIKWNNGTTFHMMGFDLNVPYDVYLDTIDTPDEECAHFLFFRKDLIDQPEADQLARSYSRLITQLAAQPELVIGDADL